MKTCDRIRLPEGRNKIKSIERGVKSQDTLEFERNVKPVKERGDINKKVGGGNQYKHMPFLFQFLPLLCLGKLGTTANGSIRHNSNCFLYIITFIPQYDTAG